MRLGIAAFVLFVSTASATIVGDVKDAIARNDFRAGERAIAEYRKTSGVTPEMLEALSWLGRGALAAKNLDAADRYAAETRKLALQLLQKRKLDDERRLPIALGASIEVQAQAMAARGDRSEAVEFLRRELERWGSTSIHERIRKNLNLLSLEGRPAPPLSAERWLGAKAPALEGRPQLIFLWAHWCGDCKSMAGTLAGIQKKYADKGLVVIAPTKLYGYAARGEDAAPEQETRYIDEVRRQYYSAVSPMPVPVSAGIFRTYGVSTTPTIVLVDRKGIVRLYHPGLMPPQELGARVDAMLRR